MVGTSVRAERKRARPAGVEARRASLLVSLALALAACPAPAVRPTRYPPATKPAPAPPRTAPKAGKAPPAPASRPAAPAGAETVDLGPVREVVSANATAIGAKRWPRTDSQVCAPSGRSAFGLDRSVFLDERGRIRRYVVVKGTDDVTYRIEHDYDGQGKLRFCLATAGAASGATFTERLYFSEAGALLARERTDSAERYGFVPGWPDDSVVRNPDADFVSPPPKECGR